MHCLVLAQAMAKSQHTPGQLPQQWNLGPWKIVGRNQWGCKIKNFVVWYLMVPTSYTHHPNTVLRDMSESRSHVRVMNVRIQNFVLDPQLWFLFMCVSTSERKIVILQHEGDPSVSLRCLGVGDWETWLHLTFTWRGVHQPLLSVAHSVEPGEAVPYILICIPLWS